jgi:hypothetical protein
MKGTGRDLAMVVVLPYTLSYRANALPRAARLMFSTNIPER